jgi:hypothetical protein
VKAGYANVTESQRSKSTAWQAAKKTPHQRSVCEKFRYVYTLGWQELFPGLEQNKAFQGWR